MALSGNPILAARLSTDDPRAIAEVKKVLEEHDGNISHAARALGVCRRTLHHWLKKYPAIRCRA